MKKYFLQESLARRHVGYLLKGNPPETKYFHQQIHRSGTLLHFDFFSLSKLGYPRIF